MPKRPKRWERSQKRRETCQSLKGTVAKGFERPNSRRSCLPVLPKVLSQNGQNNTFAGNQRQKKNCPKEFRRFLFGCPPRKKNDSSIGDAINWEWIVECANACQAEIHIVSRDTDYGITLEEKS